MKQPEWISHYITMKDGRKVPVARTIVYKPYNKQEKPPINSLVARPGSAAAS